MLFYYFLIGNGSWNLGILYVPWPFVDKFSFENGNLRSVNGIIPINVRDCYWKFYELVAFHYAFKVCAGRESNSVL